MNSVANAGRRTTCPYCGVGCGVIAQANGAIVGDPEHPANAGRLCSKGSALAETLVDDARLLYPEINGRRVSWHEALGRVAANFTRTIEQYGPSAVALYVSGQFLTEDYYVANKLMKGFIGSANIDTNSRLCMASSVAGHVRAFGEDVVSGCYDDIEECDLAILVGSNMAWCHPVLYQRLIAARARRGTRIVVVDPRRTATCDEADLHLAIKPGTDVVLFDALLADIAKRGAVNRPWVDAHTTGFTDAARTAQASAGSLDAAAAVTEVPEGILRTLCDWFIATERVMTFYSQGVNQSSAGTDKVNAIVNCHLATGRIGRAGMGPFSLTGQPNAMGGREVGGLANQLAAHMSFGDPRDVDRVRRFWRAPRIATAPGLKAIDLFDAVRDGRVKALWITGTNPAATVPRAERVREALAACPFVVVSDCWPTDTTRFAHVLLPAAGWSEKDGTVTNSERRISRQRAFRPAPGYARPDWWMLAETAKRMGWRDAFDYANPAAIFREHAALSSFENRGTRRFDIGALASLSDSEYDALSPVQWPAPSRGMPPAPRLFGDGVFATGDGKARFVPTAFRPIADAIAPDRPFLLNSGRTRDQWHTMTRTGRVPRLMSHCAEPFLDLHPDDAAALGLTGGDLSRVASAHGVAVMPVRLSADCRRGEAFAAMHWNDRCSSIGPIDRLIGAATDPVSGQPELKATPVAITAVPVRWRGFLVRRRDADMPLGDFYWSRVPIDRGGLSMLAGWTALPGGEESEDWVLSLLDAPPHAELVIYADPRHDSFRYASIVDGRLDACLFLAGSGLPLPSPYRYTALLGDPIAGDRRGTLLADANALATEAAGPMVCTCFQINRPEIERAIRAENLRTVAAIGQMLGAGTNCGSCLPELSRILREAAEPASAPSR